MPYLIVAVVLACALGTLNLVLTLAVIRRLREHSDLLAAHTTRTDDGIIEAGQAPGDFAAIDADGEPVLRKDLTGETLVAFFSPDCRACVEALPRFLAQAAAFPGGRGKVLAVVSGDGPEKPELAGSLAVVARVVLEDAEGGLATAFQVRAFPSWCLLDTTGTVQISGTGSVKLPRLAPA